MTIILKITFIVLICNVFYCFCGVDGVTDFSPSGSLLSGNVVDDELPLLEPIQGTRNFRINGKKGKDEKPWFDGRDLRHIHCVRPGRCEQLKNQTCFGSKIPYSLTSLDLTDSLHQEESRERLASYEALRNIPKCWAVIQPFLCAVFLPKCKKFGQEEMVYLPSLEMCRITLEPCRILYNTSFFPEFLNCNETWFPSKCNNDVREMKFNATGQCLLPLVQTDSPKSYYTDIEGCGVQCKNPLYTDDEHRQIHNWNGWGATICMLFNLFAIATFVIDWQNANKYPALIIFYINCCFLVNCVGFLFQFIPGNRDDIVCRKDGTLRHSEPSAGENLSCIFIFVLVYYSLVAVMVWFVILTYSWHLRAIGNVQDRLDKKGSYFHLVAWSFPLVLTITIMALSEVDGNSIVGICFVGYFNHSIRAAFLLGPLCAVLFVGGFFIIRGMKILNDLKNFAGEIKSKKASEKIRSIIARMGLSTIFAFIFIVGAIICQFYEFRHSHLWTDSLREFIKCKISTTNADLHRNCKLVNRPSVAILQLQIMCLFGSGIVMSSWCWTRSSKDTWLRFIKKKCGKEVNEEVKIQKHKVIARTWAKRKEKGRISIPVCDSHTDPVGLNFNLNDINSTGTNDISSTFANNLLLLTKRRFALTGSATNSSSCGPRKSSLDSEISISVRHVSVESRRNSVDSQVSVKIAEVQTKVARRTHGGGTTVKGKTRNRRRDFHASSGLNKRFHRRESNTSVESQVIATMKKTGYSSAGFFSGNDKSMKRRSANAGLVDANNIRDFLNDGRLMQPFFQNQGMTTRSEDEDDDDDEDIGSRTSFKIQDSSFVIRKQLNRPQSKGDDDFTQTDAESKIYPSVYDYDNLNKINVANSTDNSVSKGAEGSRTSKNSLNSELKRSRSRRSSRQSGRRNRKNSKNVSIVAKRSEKASANNGNFSAADSSFASYSSDLEIPLNGGGCIQSSYSGISLAKTHSRNSKTSCDVATQANAFEIATQTMSYEVEGGGDNAVTNISLERNGNKFENADEDNDDNDDDDVFTENHQLLLPPTNYNGNVIMIKKKDTTVSRNRDSFSMSESEKLKMLLLPSK